MIVDALRATIGTPEGMYLRRKMTAWLRRQGRDVHNSRRLHGTLGNVPPDEFEDSYYADLNQASSRPVMSPT